MLNNWLNTLERKYRHLGINNLIGFIVGANALVYLLTKLDTTGRFLNQLTLRPDLVMQGEVWRLITYLFIPLRMPTPLFFLIFLYLFYRVGRALEYEWGSFKFTLYYVLGAVGTTVAAFLTGGAATAFYLNISLILAFTAFYPEFTLYLFFVLPVKVKYIGILIWIYLGIQVLFGPIATKITVVVALINYFIFFGEDTWKLLKNRKQVRENRKRFKPNTERKGPIHRCHTCGITEEDDPDMQFRYCSKCEGDYEYCMDHLKSHEHLSKQK